MDAIRDCVPLAQIAQPQIEALKAWAVRSGAKSASLQYSDNERLTLKQIHQMLKVDREEGCL